MIVLLNLYMMYAKDFCRTQGFHIEGTSKTLGGNLVKHWNMLVEMCETEYCIMSSDDDVYSPTFLEEINNLTEKYPDVCL